MPREYKMYINGEWVGALDGEVYDDLNPYTGEVFARVPSGKRSDAKRAVDAAVAAFPEWSHTLPAERQALFLKAADILEKKKNEIVTILAEETGGTFGFAMFQTHFTPGLLREAAAQAHQANGEIIPADLPGAFYMAVRQPVGVVAGIAPWNAPLILSLRSICMPIAYGNTAVLKPSTESAAAGGVVIAEVFHEAGFPKGVLNLITNGPGGSGEIGDEFIENPKVRRINLTGSTAVGRQLAEKAGRHLKRVALELGGQNPMIILRDADIENTVNAAAFGGFNHQGQICMSTRRVIVEKPIAREFTEKFVKKVSTFKVGNPKEPDTIIGPLINKQQFNQVKDSVDAAVRDGAKILCGGKSEGLCYYPTVLTNVKSGTPFSYEETFGPVVSLIEVENEEEAVAVANDTPYGLSAAVVTRDFAKGMAIAERIESGIVHINDQTVSDEPQVPFGGVKDSGWGRFGGRAGLEEFTELRWISMQFTPRHYPF
ncbi:MAG: aldehyde dehydrogenase family protein [Syntrophobacterales bacterium]|nr:MAG: aldehyde dehydrogenase family protein [Syntrophobacterales bacterium]